VHIYTIEKKKISTDFLNKISICKNILVSNLFFWVFDDILAEKSIEEISIKFIIKHKDNKLAEIPCEIFEIFNLYKNNENIDWKKARYLRYCNGILATNWYFDSGKFKIVFLTVNDIIRELDGIGFFIWINRMCIRDNKNN